MTLKIYNSLSKTKETFSPIHPGKVGIYVCGMTVYDLCHIGHARVLVVFDMITRFLRQSGYDVTYVRNITDIDDKIIQRANENNETIEALTHRFIEAMHQDESSLGVLSPDIEPKATTHIEQIIELIQTLITKDMAYQANNGDVYYRVTRFENYASLSKKSLDELQVGARVDIDTYKESPLDFVLWKSAKPNEPFWKSPWGDGRPGWHIECSAMSMDCLGKTFDIHGGGFDLQFPHHDNEIAQSEAATGQRFVNTWMHVGFVQVNEEKMSKSLGNFFTVRDVLKDFSGEVIRFFILNSHYRSQINYSEDNLIAAQNSLNSLYTALRGKNTSLPLLDNNDYEKRFLNAMNDDFNTPEAISILFELAHNINKSDNTEIAAQLAALLNRLASGLGILQLDPNSYFQGQVQDNDEVSRIEQLITARAEARQNKNWQRADEIRAELDAMKIVLEDGAKGTTWKKV